jgi:hypothetical protein
VRLARNNFGAGASPQAVEAAIASDAEEQEEDQRNYQESAGQAGSVFHGQKGSPWDLWHGKIARV